MEKIKNIEGCSWVSVFYLLVEKVNELIDCYNGGCFIVQGLREEVYAGDDEEYEGENEKKEPNKQEQIPTEERKTNRVVNINIHINKQ
jgi:hypothetical protein